jgi:D-alanine-D-alanine ligase
MLSPSKIRVGVLRGGPVFARGYDEARPSSEYDVSLKTGGHVLKNLPDKYDSLDIFIDQDGVWHMHGMQKSPDRILGQVDVVFNALHGAYGEDGQVQHLLQTHHVPFTGSTSFASSVGMNKVLSKELFLRHNLKTPQYIAIRNSDDMDERASMVFQSFVMPVVVKPATAGSSVGVSIAKTFSEIKSAIMRAFEHSHVALIEECIIGKEATCGVIEKFRGESLYALMPVEIRPKKSSFFDYDAKYADGGSEEICPGNFSDAEKTLIENYAKSAHQALGLRHYSRSDFIITPKRGVYILEVNTQPGLTEQSLFPKALSAGGTHISQFLDHVLTLAITR